MTSTVVDSLVIATDLIAVRYQSADAVALLARCDAWLASASAEEQAIRASRFNVTRKLDMHDKAIDRVRAVPINCLEAVARKCAA